MHSAAATIGEITSPVRGSSGKVPAAAGAGSTAVLCRHFATKAAKPRIAAGVALVAYLLQQTTDIPVSLSPTIPQVDGKPCWRGRLGRHMSSFGKAFEAHPLVDDPPGEPQLGRDRCNGLTCVIHGPNLGKRGQQEGTSRHVGKLSRLALDASFSTRRQTIAVTEATRIGAAAADRALQPAQLALNCSPQVLHKVKAVGDLLRVWGTLTRRIGVEPITITSDQLDARTLGQPRHGADSRAIGQDVDHCPTPCGGR